MNGRYIKRKSDNAIIGKADRVPTTEEELFEYFDDSLQIKNLDGSYKYQVSGSSVIERNLENDEIHCNYLKQKYADEIYTEAWKSYMNGIRDIDLIKSAWSSFKEDSQYWVTVTQIEQARLNALNWLRGV